MAPVWNSGFRPFFLASAVYAPAIMLVSLATFIIPELATGAVAYGPQWHGHELLCGWAGALIGGFLLTALPSWAGAREIGGLRLVILFLVWALGRLAMWLQPWLPALVVAGADLAFFLLLAVALVPTLLQAAQRRYLAVVLILAMLFAGNLAFHLGALEGDPSMAGFGLQWVLAVLTFLFSVIAGFLVPVFTENALRKAGHATAIPRSAARDIAAAAGMLIYLATTLMATDVRLMIGAGAVALLLHTARLVRWYHPALAGMPLVWVLHLAYAWLLLSIFMRMLSAWSPAVPVSASVHAFTVGALGLMQIGLLCRVTLRHTGRMLVVPPPMVAAMFLMLAAAGLRVAAALVPSGPLLAVAALMWLAPPLLFIACHGRMLLAPSLPVSPHRPGAQ